VVNVALLMNAVAAAALQLDCTIEPRLRVTRALAMITCKTGAGRTWQALAPEIQSAGELDGRVSLKVRAHVDQALQRKLIEKQAHVHTATWGGSTLLQTNSRAFLKNKLEHRFCADRASSTSSTRPSVRRQVHRATAGASPKCKLPFRQSR
jgi:hypothetical protein